jgi:hypothetical protein
LTYEGKKIRKCVERNVVEKRVDKANWIKDNPIMILDQSKLFEPQRPHALKILDSIYMNGVAADLSETGTGKTYSACWVASKLKVPVLVICPKIMIPTWEKTMNEFNNTGKVVNYEQLIRGNTNYVKYNPKAETGPDRYEISIPKNVLIILDECHKCKAITSKNSYLMASIKKQKYKMLLMSASAATNPLEMRSFGYATGLHNYTNFGVWVQQMGAETNRWGHYDIDMEDGKIVNQMRNIHFKLYDDLQVASRMKRNQFGKYFPDNKIIPDPVDMGEQTNTINNVYYQMEAELAQLEEKASNYSQHHFAIMMKARRMIELLKVPTMVEHIVNKVENLISPVVFVNFKETLNAIEKRLEEHIDVGNLVGKIVGGQTDKRRNIDIEEFNSDKKRVMLVNIKAGNAGISLHDTNGKHPRHSMIVPNFSAVDILQSMGRVYRAGGKTPVEQSIMFASDTIEERACRRVAGKLDNLSILNDNDLFVDNIY